MFNVTPRDTHLCTSLGMGSRGMRKEDGTRAGEQERESGRSCDKWARSTPHTLLLCLQTCCFPQPEECPRRVRARTDTLAALPSLLHYLHRSSVRSFVAWLLLLYTPGYGLARLLHALECGSLPENESKLIGAWKVTSLPLLRSAHRGRHILGGGCEFSCLEAAMQLEVWNPEGVIVARKSGKSSKTVIVVKW